MQQDDNQTTEALTEEREVFTVSELNATARTVLEECFPLIWVEGEISNLARPSSGHIYFTLKDERAQVRCAFFKGRNRSMANKLENGMQVMVRASVSLYEGRGDYQLIIEFLEEVGDGALQRAFEQLKQKLKQEGLFDSKYKKSLPELPQCIGVVTSATGAAIRDILHVLARRFPAIPVIIYPTAVQGAAAAAQIVKAIGKANQRQECDILILARGGGSLEDLWPFNEELVARAIYASDIPIVSGVGHEVDFTIADFVADARAPTPSAAAELISPNQIEWLQTFQGIQQRFGQLLKQIIRQAYLHLEYLTKRMRHPGDLLREQTQRLDHIEITLVRMIHNQLQKHAALINEARLKLARHHPQNLIKEYHNQFNVMQQRMQRAITQQLNQAQSNLQTTMRALDAISPLATLKRGYAIVIDDKQHVVTKATQVKPGQQINARLSEGRLACVVEKILPET